jgi:hypothetical protein
VTEFTGVGKSQIKELRVEQRIFTEAPRSDVRLGLRKQQRINRLMDFRFVEPRGTGLALAQIVY